MIFTNIILDQYCILTIIYFIKISSEHIYLYCLSDQFKNPRYSIAPFPPLMFDTITGSNINVHCTSYNLVLCSSNYTSLQNKQRKPTCTVVVASML